MTTKRASKNAKTTEQFETTATTDETSKATTEISSEHNPTIVSKSGSAVARKESGNKQAISASSVAKRKSKTTKVQPQKAIASPAKKKAVADKKVRIASTCYHYYRHFLKDFLRSHAPSTRFRKAEESYDGHIVIFESEKAKGLKALEKWKKENPDAKDLFWDVKK